MRRTLVCQSLRLSFAKLTETSISDEDRCLKFDLPRDKQIEAFVDAETESKTTMASMNAGGERKMSVATIRLDRLGVMPNLLRTFGLLSTLYIKKNGLSSETSSQTVSK